MNSTHKRFYQHFNSNEKMDSNKINLKEKENKNAKKPFSNVTGEYIDFEEIEK